MSKKTKTVEQALSGGYFSKDTLGCFAECHQDLIRKRAYQIFEARGCETGRELEDWLLAEREVKRHLGL
jgi:hypothetical protein